MGLKETASAFGGVSSGHSSVTPPSLGLERGLRGGSFSAQARSRRADPLYQLQDSRK